MEKGPLPQEFTVGSNLPPAGPSGVGNDAAWRFLVLLFACTAVAGVSVFACWRLCGKDLLLTLKAKRSRTITELGFGQTPEGRYAGRGAQQVGQVGGIPG
ncbi:movement protein [Melinis repens associated virus]|uniref:Movement protein n=1 Tax=Melinis repens associated virus TaxID=2596882 RepID=A0A516F3J4_9GEMI|nr:movement protein [Melinis repens associated virus]QDO73336.1 movement protein [Melinis repens associated virus]WKU84285.1 movement protein [Melinis repens associated virus]